MSLLRNQGPEVYRLATDSHAEANIMKRWHWIVLIVLAAVTGAGLWLYYQLTTFTVTKLTNDVHMLAGLGGNVTVVRTGQGAVVVDSMTFKIQGQALRKRAETLAGEFIRIVISTHYHGDHTHGNPGFDPKTRFISSANTVKYLKRCDQDYWANGIGFPTEHLSENKTIKLGSKTFELILPGPGHTGGDLVVRIVEDSVVVMGDLFFNHYYPNIDLEAGGSVRKWADTIDNVLAQPAMHVVPGHGKAGTMADLKQFRAFIKELSVQATATANLTETEALKAAKLTTDKDYGVISIPFILNLDRDFVVKRAWAGSKWQGDGWRLSGRIG